MAPHIHCHHWLVQHLYDFAAVSVGHHLGSNHLTCQVVLVLVLSGGYWSVVAPAERRDNLLMISQRLQLRVIHDLLLGGEGDLPCGVSGQADT